MSTTQVVVGRIGKPHGIRGELSVEPRTDEPDRRFAVGVVLRTQEPRGSVPRGEGRPTLLTVEATRWHQSRLLVRFAPGVRRTVRHETNALDDFPSRSPAIRAARPRIVEIMVLHETAP